MRISIKSYIIPIFICFDITFKLENISYNNFFEEIGDLHHITLDIFRLTIDEHSS